MEPMQKKKRRRMRAVLLKDDSLIHVMSFLPAHDIQSFLNATGWDPVDHCVAALLKIVFRGQLQDWMRIQDWLAFVPPRILTPKLISLMQRAGAQVNAKGGLALLRACFKQCIPAVHALLRAGADPRASGTLYQDEPTPLSQLLSSCRSKACDPVLLDAVGALVEAGAPVTYHARRAVSYFSDADHVLRILNQFPRPAIHF
jgi:hypothetical protein